MAKKSPAFTAESSVFLGENPVNNYQAREYAKESSPGVLAVLVELTENAQDNGTEVKLTIDAAGYETREGKLYIRPRKIICTDNGVGLSHAEFLTNFCGAFSDSEIHHEADRAGRNGVGTKTYTSIAGRVIVRTTTARPTDGFDQHDEAQKSALREHLQVGLTLPKDGEPDTVRRAYEFQLHNRRAIPAEWERVDAEEMGTQVELLDVVEDTEICYPNLIERLSFKREWLRNTANSLYLTISGNVPIGLAGKRKAIKPWSHPVQNWLIQASGRSDEDLIIHDPGQTSPITVKKVDGIEWHLAFDFRVAGKDQSGQMISLQEPALLLETSGALPYPPLLEGVRSARTLPLLTFVGLEHASSIGSFCNAVCGFAYVNAISLKQALRNNKTTLASGPAAPDVDRLRKYIHEVLWHLHRAWYNATRQSHESAVADARKTAEEQVNLALKGVNRNLFTDGEITHDGDTDQPQPPTPIRRHRWECGACGKRWLAEAGFTPANCAQASAGDNGGDGCGSTNIGLGKNQPRIGDCRILTEQLGDPKLPASFQFERAKADEDHEIPTVRVNIVGPRYVELRGTGSMSGQAQQRLSQYMIEVALMAIADHNSKRRGTDVVEELGSLYYNRMLKSGLKRYQSAVANLLKEGAPEQSELVLVTEDE